MRFLIPCLIAVVVGYLGLGVIVAAIEPSLVFRPRNTPLEDCRLPPSVRLIDFDGERGLFTEGGGRGLLIFYHGNSGTACSWRFLGANHASALGFDTLAMEYPGYGGDPRDTPPSADTIRSLVERTHRWTQARYSNIVAMGFSLGTGAASYQASLSGIEKVVLFAPYQSLFELAQNYGYPFSRFWFQNDLDNVDTLIKAQAPVHIIYGGRDKIVPPESSEALIKRLRGAGVQITDTKLPDAGHIGLFGRARINEILQAVLDDR